MVQTENQGGKDVPHERISDIDGEWTGEYQLCRDNTSISLSHFVAEGTATHDLLYPFFY